MQPVRIIHFADLHIGVDRNGPVDPETAINGRVLDFLDALDAAVDYAVENDADLALFAGDAFHKHNPDPTYVREFAERIIRLAEQCPVVLLLGNHDMPGIIEKATAIDMFDVFNVPNVIVGWRDELHIIKTKRGSVQVATVPYPMKQQLLTAKQLRKCKDVKQLLQAAVKRIIINLAEQVVDTMPAVLVGHFSVTNATYGSERMLSLDNGAEVALEDLLDPWDYVALGHLHMQQCLTEDYEDAAPVVYSGSLERVDFGEEHQPKGFMWVEIGDEIAYDFVEVDARPYVTIDVIVSKSKHPTEKVLQRIQAMDLQSAVVRIRINAVDSSYLQEERIHQAVIQAGAYFVHSLSITRRPVKTETRLADVKLSTLPAIDALQVYLEETGAKNIPGLLQLAREVMCDG